jgi:hypothetical protein
MRRLEKNRQEPIEKTNRFDDYLMVIIWTSMILNRSNEWYDFYSRTDEVLVPSKWVSRLDEANAVDNQLEYLREKIEQDFPE